jgi:hypothetical protein
MPQEQQKTGVRKIATKNQEATAVKHSTIANRHQKRIAKSHINLTYGTCLLLYVQTIFTGNCKRIEPHSLRRARKKPPYKELLRTQPWMNRHHKYIAREIATLGMGLVSHPMSIICFYWTL